MKKMIYFLILTIIFLMSCTANSKVEVTGEIKGGLRVIDISKSTKLDFTVYRGDYIVFNLKDRSTSNIKILELDFESILPMPKSGKPYIKMKEVGTYNIIVGEKKGILRVIEYTGNSNYIEVTAAEATELIKNISPFILDVRTKGEYESGYIQGAGLLPVQNIADNLDKLEQFKDEPIFVYCQSGNRSTVASKILIDAGFKKIYNLRYGIGDWKKRGFQVVK
ncbi:MAG: rhodanese-like domain-containing protein [Spirochaetaceae bacterium]